MKYFNLLKKINKNNAISTSIFMCLYGITHFIKNKNYFYNEIILTGGGRKNKYLLKLLKDNLPNNHITVIDNYGYNGDLIESQMFAYLAIRSIKKLIISNPNTTRVKKSISGGKLYNSN